MLYCISLRQAVNITHRIHPMCQWRMIPNDFGIPWFVLYAYYRRWGKRGVWETILCKLIEASRLKKERCATPTFAIIDSQSVKTIYEATNVE